jgi:6,7-dimethyl-8-ribityllumazine synthase
MLQPVTRRRRRTAGGRFAIVASRYNGHYVNAMLKAARAELLAAGVDELRVIRVPGAFEIPAVVARLARLTAPGFDAILCLGVILRGQTTHAEHIGTGVTQALIQLQVETGRPLIHEVLLLENEEQARARCLSRDHNRGTEAAQTALAMAAVMRALPMDPAPADDEPPF